MLKKKDFNIKLEKKLNSDFIINFLQNGIIAVCENFEEAVFARKNGASGILIVRERGSECENVFVMANEDLISQVLEEVAIPVFVRIKFGHFGEAKICEELGVDGVVEGFQNDKSLDKKLNEDDFDLVIISEIFESKNFLNSNKNILILGDYATGNFNSIKEKFSDIEKKFSQSLNGENFFLDKNIFLGGGISSVADLDILESIGNIKGFFVGSAIFDLESDEFFKDYWDYKRRI